MKEMLRNPGYTALIPLFLHGNLNKDVFFFNRNICPFKNMTSLVARVF